MPSVQAPASILKASAVVVQAAVPVITKTEIQAAIDAIASYRAAEKQAYAAEKARDAATLVVFEKALGVKSLDEVKALSPEAMAELLQKRTTSQTYGLEPGCDFNFQNPASNGSRRCPKWKEAFVQANGEAAAKQLEMDTKPTYTWHIVPVQGENK